MATTIKIGHDKSDGTALFRAFLWWLHYPTPHPPTHFPTTFADAALDCNRQRLGRFRFVRESYGYEFACSDTDTEAINTLRSVAQKAKLDFAKVP